MDTLKSNPLCRAPPSSSEAAALMISSGWAGETSDPARDDQEAGAEKGENRHHG